MKKVLITMSALAIALATTSVSNAACCGSNYSYGNGYNYNYAYLQNGNCCGAAAPIYTYYVPLAPKCCVRSSSCCGR